jgi:hypothetical protein
MGKQTTEIDHHRGNARGRGPLCLAGSKDDSHFSSSPAFPLWWSISVVGFSPLLPLKWPQRSVSGAVLGTAPIRARDL